MRGRRRLLWFRRIHLGSRLLRRGLAPAGLLLALVTGLAGALGLDTLGNQAHAVFALGLGLLLVDGLLARRRCRRVNGLRAHRRLPRFATVGTPIDYSLELVADRSTPPLLIDEILAQPWPEGLPAVGTGNRFDRRVGYPAYLRLLRQLRGLSGTPVQTAALITDERRLLTLRSEPTGRAVAEFVGPAIAIDGPLGLVRWWRSVPQTGDRQLAVLPPARALSLPPPDGRRRWQPGGVSLAMRVGDAEEFRSLRDYRPGDPLRDIHWRSFARLGKPLVREHQEEFFARHALVIDTATAPYTPALEVAVAYAVGLVTAPREPDCLLDLLFVAGEVHRMTSGRGLGSGDGLLRVLAGLRASGPGSTDLLFRGVSAHVGEYASLIVVLLAWDTPRREALRALFARGVAPWVLVVGDPVNQAAVEGEDDPLFAGRVHALAFD